MEKRKRQGLLSSDDFAGSCSYSVNDARTCQKDWQEIGKLPRRVFAGRSMRRTTEMAKIEALIGKTLTAVTLNKDRDVIDFETADGGNYQMYHSQDCCESVTIEDIEGDIQSLVGTPILTAEEAASANPEASESGTWTFYKLATIKGHVDIRWYGSSNGYYSERVSFRDMDDASDYGW